MAGTKISALAALTTVADGDLLPIVDVSDPGSGTTKQVTAVDVATYVADSAGMAAEFAVRAAVPLHDTYTGKADGAAPVAADTGQIWINSGQTWTIDGGRLVNADAAAFPSYRDFDMGSKVARLGVRFVFPVGAGAGLGDVALLAWETSFLTAPQPPDSPFHLSIGLTQAGFGIWDAQVFTSLLVHAYPAPLAADDTTEYVCEGFIEGDTATIVFPDGHIATVTDSRIASLNGDFAGFEITGSGGTPSTRPKIVEVWASATSEKSYSTVPLDRITQQIAAAAVPDRMLYTTTGSNFYVVPQDASWADVTLVAGGGGGGAGRRGAAGTIRSGGGGGQGGGRTTCRLWLVPLRGVNLTVSVGVGGAGAAAIAVNDTSGLAGTAGGNSFIVSGADVIAHAQGGGGGGAGDADGAAGGAGFGWGTQVGGAGGASSTTGLAGGTGVPTAVPIPDGAGGAGAGGGVTAADVASAGGGGGFGQLSVSSTAGMGVGAGGAVSTNGGAATSHNAAILASVAPPGGCGAGGGGSSITTTGGTGGLGALYGGGGGGGGASLNGNNSGGGGAGRQGAVLMVVT